MTNGANLLRNLVVSWNLQDMAAGLRDSELVQFDRRTRTFVPPYPVPLIDALRTTSSGHFTTDAGILCMFSQTNGRKYKLCGGVE